MAKIKTNEYYQGFVTVTEYACKASKMLKNALTGFDAGKLKQQLHDLHEIERAADHLNGELTRKLAGEFITPIERDDIYAILNSLDDVIDGIDMVLISIYMNNIRTIRPSALEKCDLIIRCCEKLKELMTEFPHFKKSTSIAGIINEMHLLEEEGDRLYMESMHILHANTESTLEILAWRSVYKFFEKCFNAADHTADTVERAVIKNS